MLPETPEDQPAENPDTQKPREVISPNRERIRDMINMDVFLGGTGMEERYDMPGSGLPRWPTPAFQPIDDLSYEPKGEVLGAVFVNLKTGEIRHERPVLPVDPVTGEIFLAE